MLIKIVSCGGELIGDNRGGITQAAAYALTDQLNQVLYLAFIRCLDALEVWRARAVVALDRFKITPRSVSTMSTVRERP